MATLFTFIMPFNIFLLLAFAPASIFSLHELDPKITHPPPFTFLPSLSFSTHFSFSLSHTAHALYFRIVPSHPPSRFFEVGFKTIDPNHVCVHIATPLSLKSTNASSIAKELHSWVDYDCTSKRLEVRLSEFGGPRPYHPLLVYQVDLGTMWNQEQVLVGLTSSSFTSVYSWKFRVWSVPKGLHSQPVDPRKAVNENDKRWFHLLSFLAGVIFVTGCVVLVAFVGLFLWVIFGTSTELVIPAKCRDFRYEKVDVVVEDGSTPVKN